MTEKKSKKENGSQDVSKLTYEQAYRMLENTVGRMSEQDVPLEELMGLYENAVLLGSHCEKLLKGYEARMEKVSSETLRMELETAEEDDDEPPFEVDDEDDEF